jgi:hypothetical protein
MPSGLTQQLRQGATLILDAIDEMHAPIARVAECLEGTFREKIQVNAYAGWGSSKGFDLHWDDHDVLVVQVAGRKQWAIYGPTRQYPLFRDIEPNVQPPSNAIWTGELSNGDVLYIPRGWWHEACALGEPTLHLTFGINHRNGIDLLGWIVDQVREKEAFRMDIPRYSGSKDLRKHAARLRAELAEFWTDELVVKFLEDQDAKIVPRPHLSLPWSVMPTPLPPSDRASVRFVGGLPTLSAHRAAGAIELLALGKRFTFRLDIQPVLVILLDRQEHPISELCEAVAGSIDARTVRLFLGELILEGLIAVCPERPEGAVGN